VKVTIIFISSNKKVKDKVPAHAMKAYRGSRGITPLILNLGNMEKEHPLYSYRAQS
jgi:hypothetical protein